HYVRMCPHKPNTMDAQRAARSEQTVGDVGRAHRVYAAVDNRQAEHQATVIETTGTIRGISVFVLFDSGASDSFISPSIVDQCGLVVARQPDSWQVELASGAKLAVDS
ncbi:hypothetical protein KI387_021489, partial [Taxus chinensis]